MTITDAVSQPTLCFGKMMEQGWTIDGREQMMLHHDALEEIKAPVEMHKKKCDCDGLHSSSSANPPPNQDDDCRVG